MIDVFTFLEAAHLWLPGDPPELLGEQGALEPGCEGGQMKGTLGPQSPSVTLI